MLQEDEPAARPQHPEDLAQRPSGVGDAAHRPGAHHAIERLVGERQLLATERTLIHGHAALGDAPACEPVHAGVGIDGRDPADVLRVVGQVQARAEADLQHLAAHVGEQLVRSRAILGSLITQSQRRGKTTLE